MPEPGIGDRDFDRTTTDRKKFRRRSKARVKLPGEYAEFRLSDGRFLGDVMGDGFFGPESGADGGNCFSNERMFVVPMHGVPGLAQTELENRL